MKVLEAVLEELQRAAEMIEDIAAMAQQPCCRKELQDVAHAIRRRAAAVRTMQACGAPVTPLPDLLPKQ